MVIITPEIIEFDSKVIRLAAAYRSRATPNNLYMIQQKILAKDTLGTSSLHDVESQVGILGFSYNYRKRDNSDVVQALKDLKVPRGLLKGLYVDKINESILKMKMLEAIGTDRFSDASRKLYGYPDKKLIDKAYGILDLEPNQRGETFSTQKGKTLLKKKLDEMGIKWKINSRKLLGYALVTPSKHQVTLSSNHKYTEETINRLAVHEIGTHGVRYMNAKAQPLKIFKNFPGYLATEEGLAAFTEEITGYLNNDTLRRYAGRVVAVEYAQNHTLLETYDYLKQFFDGANALHIAMRIKRGLPNSESFGAYTKDHVYLRGFMKIKEYIKNNPLRYLYYGKVGVEYLKIIKKLEPELTKIRYFPPLITSFDRNSELF